jgi:hypothetical protein
MDREYWCTPVDNYCERDSAAFWAEPVNALSNGAFLVAAACAFILWRRSGRGDLPVLLLIGVTAIVGIGSFLFHTFANRWSLLADVLPIMVFIYGYFLLAMRRYFGLGIVAAGAITLAFFGFNFVFMDAWRAIFGTGPVATANGSVGYFPAALALMGVGGLLVLGARRAQTVLDNRKNRNWAPMDDTQRERAMALRVAAPERAGNALLVAAAIFAASLVFRSIDFAVCGWLPVGTHFMWHTLNALVLFTLLKGAIDYRATAAPARS